MKRDRCCLRKRRLSGQFKRAFNSAGHFHNVCILGPAVQVGFITGLFPRQHIPRTGWFFSIQENRWAIRHADSRLAPGMASGSATGPGLKTNARSQCRATHASGRIQRHLNLQSQGLSGAHPGRWRQQYNDITVFPQRARRKEIDAALAVSSVVSEVFPSIDPS